MHSMDRKWLKLSNVYIILHSYSYT